MRLRISVVSVTVLTFLFVFLFQENVKAQTGGICSRTHLVENEILAQISSMFGGGIECEDVTSAQLAAITELRVFGDGPNVIGGVLGNLTSLQSGDFAGLTGLQTLYLSHNRLRALPANIFAGLTNLTHLELWSNILIRLDPNVFNGLTSLQELYLHQNELTELDENLFNGLTNLQVLRLDRNELTEIPARIFNDLTALTDLRLDDNILRTLPPGIFSSPGLENLEHLDISRRGSGSAGPFLPLFVILKASGGMAVVEIAQGVPFISVTATLSISGGTFPNGTISSTETQVTISRGETQSDEFAYTVDPNDISTIITVSDIISDPPFTSRGYAQANVGVSRYSGLELVEGPDLIFGDGVCNRTPQIRDAILAELGVNDCRAVNNARLAEITDRLNLHNESITSLQSGDFAGLTNMTLLNLGGNDLERLPDEIFSDLTSLTTLDLSFNELMELSSGIFNGLTSLTTLQLSGNELMELRSGIFSGLTSLTALDLRQNDLTALPGGIFSGLTNLRELYLVDNDLTALPGGIFSGLTNLVALPAQENTTNPLPLNVTLQESGIGMAVVEVAQGVPFNRVTATLSITGGSFSGGNATTTVIISKGETQSAPFAFTVDDSTALPEAVISITSTTSNPPNILTGFTDFFGLFGRNPTGYSGFTLASGPDLTRQMGICSRTQEVRIAILAAIPETNDCAMVTSAQLAGITGTLNLSSNFITSLKSGDFAGLTALQTLNLEQNQLTELPVEIFSDLTSLTTLNLAFNQLTESTLPANIFANLTALTSLELSDNTTLEALPSGIFSGLTQLTTLLLNDNALARLDTNLFDDLTSLTGLSLSGNALTRLDADIFNNLTNLTALTLFSNALTRLDADIFSGLTQLTTLFLNDNALTDLPPRIFSNLTNLTTLGLSLNAFTTLDANIFNGLSALESLNLADNQLTELPDGIFSGLRNLDGVRVDGQEDAGGNAIGLLPLTVTIQESTVGRVVVEVAQGVPSTTVTATLSITGGNFSGNNTTTVTLSTGQTQSDPFPYTVTDLSTVITVSNLESDPSNIATGDVIDRFPFGFRGYKGFQLAAGDPLVIGGGICNRTPQIRDAIVAVTPAVTCSTVTADHLTRITELLLSDPTPNDGSNDPNDDITTLQAGDFAGLTNLRALDLNHNALRTLPSGIFAGLENLEQLFLGFNRLEMLNANLFAGLTNLSTLNLNDNTTLEELPSGIFNGLTQLTNLLLNSNRLTDLPAGIFSGLTALEILNLDNNTLEELPVGIFNGLTALEILNLDNNALTELPPGIFSGLTRLTAVLADGQVVNGTMIASLPLDVTIQESTVGSVVVEVAQGVPFTTVTATLSITGGTFSGDTQMMDVMISKGETRSSPFEFTLSETEATISITATSSDPSDILNGSEGYSGFTFASGPALTVQIGVCDRTAQVRNAIVEAIGGGVTCSTVTSAQLAGITTLNLADRNIMSLRSGDFAGLTALTDLDLRGNQFSRRDDSGTLLSTLPADIFDGLTSLTSLILRRSFLTTLDEDIFNDLTSLTSLGLSESSLTELPSGIFSSLTQLTALGLNNNTLTELPSGIFSSLTNLTALSLNNNALTELPSGIFSSLTNLTALSLNNNALTELLPGIFSSLTNLTILNLSFNALTELPPGIFSSLTNLTALGLNNNALTELPPGIFSSLTNLRTVDVSANNPTPGDSLALTVSPKVNSEGMAVIEVAQGVPFTSVTATVTITGGTTFFGSNAISVTLSKGETQSQPFPFTVDPDHSAPSITVSSLSSEPQNISTGFSGTISIVTTNVSGYSGFRLVSGDRLTIQGICGRTQQVQDAILTAINSATPAPNPPVICSTVTDVHLAAIPELDVSDPTPNDGVGETDDDITVLQTGDFAGLTGLETLNLDENSLTTLPSGIFNALTSLRFLNLGGNQLTVLPDGIFSDLRSLEGVRVDENTLDPLPLTVTIQETGPGMAGVEVAQGVPFISVTATVSITGGTFSGDTRTMDVTISKGETRSSPFGFTLSETEATISITATSSDPTNIRNGFNDTTFIGYSGFMLASGPDLNFEARQRIEGVGESILPTVSRELISRIQNVVSGRIGRLTTSPVIAPPTAQVAGQSTFSDLLVFSAQTFDRIHNQEQSFAIETLFEETSFILPLNGEEGEVSRTGFESFALWGNADYQNVSGGDDVSWDGTITSFHIGSDMRVTEEVLGGVAVSWSSGMFDYKDRTSENRQEGEYELELLSVHPYGGWTPLPWFSLWVVGGYGFGEVTVNDEAVRESQSSDVQAYSGSVGMSVQGVLARVMTLRVKGQTSITMMEVEDNGQMISSLTTEAYQHRVSVEVSRTTTEGSVVPTLEIGWRSDGGDGETGDGVEVGGRLRYVTSYGLTVEANSRWLALHSGDVEEWGVGGSVRFERGGGEGFWANITPEWGETGSRARELWDAKIEDVERVSQEREARLGAEAGYGLGIGKALLTPSAGVSLTNQGYRSYRVGSGVIVGEFSLTLEGERRSTRSASEEESLLLEGNLRF